MDLISSSCFSRVISSKLSLCTASNVPTLTSSSIARKEIITTTRSFLVRALPLPLKSLKGVIGNGAFINNQEFIKQYAISNNVDPSFVYVFYAFDAPSTDKYAWGRAKKLNPDIEKLKSKLQHLKQKLAQ